MKTIKTTLTVQILVGVAVTTATLAMSHGVHAALLNGSFETGVAYPGGLNIFSPGTPPPWTATSFTPDCYDNSGADGWPLTGIPAYGGMFQNMLAASGNRFLGFAAGSTFNESFAQTTAPLTGGQTYTISADLAVDDLGKAANFGGPYNGRGPVDVYLNSGYIGTLAPNTASLTWQPRSFSFVAPNASSAVFTFVAGLEPLTQHPSYVGIDNVSLVPEPASAALALIGFAMIGGCGVRRRRSVPSATAVIQSSRPRLRSPLPPIVLVLAVLCGAATSTAAIVFNNIPAAPQYYHNYGNWTGTFGNQYAITATSFTPTGSGPLDSLDAGVTYGLGANSITLRLSPDAAGLPGAPIWQTTVPPAAAFGQLLSLTGIGGPLLNMGQQYWLEAVAPVSPVTVQSWWTNNQGDAGPIVATGNYVANAQRFSLRIGVLTVPEPAVWGLLLLSSAGAMVFVRSRIV